jgi:hypothetical protein
MYLLPDPLMPLSKHSFIRYQVIDACLRNKQRPYPSIDFIMLKCREKLDKSISRSSIEKDLKAMKELPEPGYYAPITFDRYHGGYYYTDPGYSISNIRVKEADYSGNTEDENIQFCVDTVKELLATGLSGEDILFLYRRSKMYANYFFRFRQDGIKVQGKTIHSAKGLEAKAVFILGLTEGNGGFPDIWLEDRIFQVIRKANHDLLLEEERRLFYVAITRAKDKLYLITEKGNESSFLKEIPDVYTVKSSISLKSVIEKINLCTKCFSPLEKLWIVCPYCGEKNQD